MSTLATETSEHIYLDLCHEGLNAIATDIKRIRFYIRRIEAALNKKIDKRGTLTRLFKIVEDFFAKIAQQFTNVEPKTVEEDTEVETIEGTVHSFPGQLSRDERYLEAVVQLEVDGLIHPYNSFKQNQRTLQFQLQKGDKIKLLARRGTRHLTHPKILSVDRASFIPRPRNVIELIRFRGVAA